MRAGELTEMAFPDGGHVVGEVAVVEVRLHEHVRAVHVRGQQQAVGRDVERGAGQRLQVAAPEDAAVGGAHRVVGDAFHRDQPFRRDRQHRGRAALGSLVPIGGGVAGTPGGGAVRFVLQIQAEYIRHVLVAVGHKAQVGQPLCLGIGAGVPELGNAGAIGGVVIQQHIHAARIEFGDHLVEDLQRGQALQVGVAAVVDAGRHGVATQRGRAERQAHGVEAQALHLHDHVLPVACPQAMHHVVAGFEAEHVHTLELHDLAAVVDDLPAVVDGIAEGRPGGQCEGGGQSERACGPEYGHGDLPREPGSTPERGKAGILVCARVAWCDRPHRKHHCRTDHIAAAGAVAFPHTSAPCALSAGLSFLSLECPPCPSCAPNWRNGAPRLRAN